MDPMGPISHASTRARRWALLAAVTAFAATAALAMGTGSAGAAKTTILGAAAPVRPACPTNCRVEGKVTAIQTGIGSQEKPFRVPFTGKIVAWSIKLGKPAKKDINFFNDLFKGEASARLAVLKPIRKKKLTYELKAQSPLEKLAAFFGSTTTFALNRPIKVKEGQLVALTIPTWAPDFALGGSSGNTWRGSRKKGHCLKPDDIAGGKAQQGIGTERVYGCNYAGARHLFTATLVRRGGDK